MGALGFGATEYETTVVVDYQAYGDSFIGLKTAWRRPVDSGWRWPGPHILA
jgi:hypothetical protein